MYINAIKKELWCPGLGLAKYMYKYGEALLLSFLTIKCPFASGSMPSADSVTDLNARSKNYSWL